MADVRFKVDRKGLKALLKSGQLRPAARAAAERGKRAAEAASPRQSGTYARSFEIRDSKGWDGRATVDLINTAGHAAAVEFGNKLTPKAHHVLAGVIDTIENGG
jgi:hypothetical protein